MNKPYLSVIIPETSDQEKLALSIIEIDKNLESAGFGYEIISFALPKLAAFVSNLKFIDAPEADYGEKVRQGVKNSSGNIRLLCLSGHASYLKVFGDFIPKFKDCDAIISRNNFMAIKEEPADFIFGKLVSKTEAIHLEALDMALKNNFRIYEADYSDPDFKRTLFKIPTLLFLKEITIIYINQLLFIIRDKKSKIWPNTI